MIVNSDYFNNFEPNHDKNQKNYNSKKSETKPTADNLNGKASRTVSCLSSVFRSIPNPGYLLFSAPICVITLLTLAGRCIVTSPSTPTATLTASTQPGSNLTTVNASIVIPSNPPVIFPGQEPAWMAKLSAQHSLFDQSVKTEDQDQCNVINAKQKNLPNHCSPFNPGFDTQSVERIKFGDRFIEVHQVSNPETLDRANEVIDRDRYFFLTTPPKIEVDHIIKAGDEVGFNPKLESNVFKYPTHLRTYNEYENTNVRYIGNLSYGEKTCAEFDDQGILKNKAELRKKLLDVNLKSGCDALVDLTTDALELMAEKSSWAGRRVKFHAYVIRYRITAETPLTGLPWHRDFVDTSLVMLMNEKANKDGVGYEGGGLNIARKDPSSRDIIKNTIEKFDYSKNGGFIFTNEGEMEHQGADGWYIGKAGGVAEKRLFALFVESKEADVES